MKTEKREVPLWIAYEKELVALPQNPKIDSAIAYQNIEEIISNRKNFEAQTINAYSGLIWQIGLVLVGLILVGFVVLPMFGQPNLMELMFKPTKTIEKTPTNDKNTTDQNTPQTTEVIVKTKEETAWNNQT